MRTETVIYTCDLTGAETRPVELDLEEEEEHFDLPEGWAHVTVRLAVPNPAARVFREQVSTVTAMRLAVGVKEGTITEAQVAEQRPGVEEATALEIASRMKGGEPAGHVLLVVEGHLAAGYTFQLDNEMWRDLTAELKRAMALAGLLGDDADDSEEGE